MDRFFGISAQGSTVRTELVAGVTTFLTNGLYHVPQSADHWADAGNG